MNFMTTDIGKKYNLNFRSGFDSDSIIVNFSTCMHAKQIILYLFERREKDLSNELQIA